MLFKYRIIIQNDWYRNEKWWQIHKHKSFVNLQPETLATEFTPLEFSSVSISRLVGHKLAVASSPKLRHGTAWAVDRPTTMGCYKHFLQLFIWIHPKKFSGDLRYSIYEFILSCSGIFAAFLNRSGTPKVESNHIDNIPPSLFCLTKSIQVQYFKYILYLLHTPKQLR